MNPNVQAHAVTAVVSDRAPVDVVPAPPAPPAPPTTPQTRWELSKWLLTRARAVLAPLVLSVVMRIAGLVAGAALIGYAAYQGANALTGTVVTGTVVTGTVATGTVITALVVIALAKAVARYLEQFFGHFVAFRALAILRTYFYRKLAPQAPAATDGRATGDLLSRATRDIDRIEVFFAHTVGPAFTAVVVPLGLTIWIGTLISWTLAFVALTGWLVVGGLVPLLGGRTALPAARRLRVMRGRIAQHTTDSIQGVREVVAFDYAERRRDELAMLGAQTHGDIAVLGRAVALRRGLNTAAMALTLSALVLFGSRLVIDGSLTVPQLAMVIGLVLGAMPAVTAVEEFVADLDQAFASAARVVAITEAPAVTPQSVTPQSVVPQSVVPQSVVPQSDTSVMDGTQAVSGSAYNRGRVELREVSFRYPQVAEEETSTVTTQTEVLHGISLTLEPGTVTALVGASGSGKSTIAQLVCRFYDPSAGSVTIDGIDLRDLDDDTLRSQISIVGQRPYLFNATIAENLRIAAPDATDEELRHACEGAALLDAVDNLPDGLDTMVGEQGLAVSGGQRQRIAIARSLLRGAGVLVLDEVTSQLDRHTEAELTATLRSLQHGRTTLVIAHRLATIRDADQIVVIEAGRIVAQGTHDDLMVASAYYRGLVDQEGDGAEA